DPTNLTPVGDQYSLGCVLYYCLTGRYPFPDGTAVEKMMCHQHKQPTPLRELAPQTPDALVEIVERLMQKQPTARYGSCAELIEALRPLAAAAPRRRQRNTMSVRALTGSKHDAPKPPAAIPLRGDSNHGRAKPPMAQPLPARAPVAQPLPARVPSAPPAKLPGRGDFARSAPAPAAPYPVAAPPPANYADPDHAYAPPPAPRQGLGMLRAILLAVVAGAVAWLLSSFIKL